MSAWNSLRCQFVGVLAVVVSLATSGIARAADAPTPEERAAAAEKNVTQGALRIVEKDGGVVECPLKHTHVQADVSGFIARVRVMQTFHNPTKEKIEAVYVFPLPHEAAIDDMTMVIGERKIVGVIKRRAEARSIYEQALLAGQTAALLEQERPNIFTQSVGNIEPNQEVKIEISYVDVLRYDMGTYEFHFPMVVGPRYIPGTPSGGVQTTPPELKGKVSPPVADTDRVPDATRISPPVLKPGVRNGHDISLSLKLDAGVPIQDLTSANHQAEITKDGERAATVKLSPADSLPNKDFVLRYGVVGKKPEMAVLGHTGDYSGDRQKLGSGYFMLMIQPQEDERLTKSPPREIVFLVDVSGSMSGAPTAKVVEAMQGMLKLCRAQDTIQVVTFASQANKLFEKPLPVNEENIAKALGFTAGLQGSGGTEMLKGVQMAIDEPIDKERLRIVVMLTDGYIGNEAEIIEHVGKKCGDQIRFWCVGIGSSPNMFLVDGVARQGGGMGKKLGLEDESQPLVQEIMTRIQRAQLAKISIDWGDLKVSETYPAKIPELWAGRPVIVYGRYAPPAIHDESVVLATVTVRGSVEGEDVSWPLKVDLPTRQPKNDVLAKVWARQKVEDLMQQSYYQGSPAVEEMVTAIALDYRLMSQYTSFVAVDESKKAETSEAARPPRRMLVPVPLPEGTRWEGFFGDEGEQERLRFDFFSVRDADKKEKLAELSKSVAGATMGRRARGATSAKYRMAAGKGFGGFAGGGAAPGFRAPPAGLMPAQPAAGFIAGRTEAGDQSLTIGLGLIESRQLRSSTRRLKASGLFQEAELKQLADVAGEALAAGDFFQNYQALATQAGKNVEAARKLYESATGKEAPSDRQALRQMLAQACFLDSAAANFGQSDGNIASQAMARIEELHRQEVAEWTKKVPQLGTKLDLVLRDQSIAEALAQVARATELDVQLLEGSAQDAAALLGTDAPRVSYLDLRHATVAQALDWILQPARLTWRPGDKGIVAGSERRMAGDSTWTYDVAAIAVPLADDLKKLNDAEKASAEAQRAADEFMAAIRQALGAKDETSVAWYSPGELLVTGSRQRHADLAKLLAALEAGGDRPQNVPARLVDETRKRFAARKETIAKAQSAAKKLDVALAHDQFSWQLMAAAAAGQLELEALTELQIAWKSPQTSELADGPTRHLVLRSLWAVREAARALPEEKELAALATAAGKQASAAADDALKAASKDRNDHAALAGVIYAALANPEDREYRSKAAGLMTVKAVREQEDAAAAELRLLGRHLISEPTADDRQALEELIGRGVEGADFVALTALACRQAGGTTWEKFRAESRDLLGEQPLPGELVVLINRLTPGSAVARKQ